MDWEESERIKQGISSGRLIIVGGKLCINPKYLERLISENRKVLDMLAEKERREDDVLLVREEEVNFRLATDEDDDVFFIGILELLKDYAESDRRTNTTETRTSACAYGQHPY